MTIFCDIIRRYRSTFNHAFRGPVPHEVSMEDYDGGTDTVLSGSIPDGSAAPDAPAPAPETAASEAPVAPKKRTRTSVRALRREIQELRDGNKYLSGSLDRTREQLNATRRRANELEDRLFGSDQELANTRTALDFVVGTIVLKSDKGVGALMADLNKTAVEFGIDFSVIKEPLLDALGTAYARTPARLSAKMDRERDGQIRNSLSALLGGGPGEPGIRAVSGSGIGPLLAALGALGAGPDRGPDPTRGIGDIGALDDEFFRAILAEDPAQEEHDPRNTPEAYFHPGKADCQGHPRR